MIETSSLNTLDAFVLFLLLVFFEVFVLLIYKDTKQGGNSTFSKNVLLGFSVLIPIMLIATLIFDTYTTRRESDTISYELTSPLAITLERDEKTKILPPKDLEGKEIVVSAGNVSEKRLKFDEGEKVNVKILEQQNGYHKKNIKDWTNARVYIVEGEKLYELSNDQIEEQGLDEVVRKLYQLPTPKGGAWNNNPSWLD